jgi:hypothetical protein
MAISHTQVFISHSTKNAAFVDKLVERLRDHYITTWYAPRHMPGGYFAENFIFLGQRSHKVQTLAGGYQPAVSGDGQPEDIDAGGVYDPFRTALREATEECLGLLTPAPTAAAVTFFGLARWMKTRFPFLFGEIRLHEATAKDVLSHEPTQKWEGERLTLPFTVEAVTEWCADRYRDQYFGRARAAVSSPIFSLLQSLRYAYPDRWSEAIRRLDLPEIPPPGGG